MFDFHGMNVLVTGASGNLGWAVAEKFEQAGAALLLPDRHKGRLLDKANQHGMDDVHIFESVDVTYEESVADFITRVQRHFDKIDILINIVGTYKGGQTPAETDYAVWEELTRINLYSTLYLSKAVIPLMVDQGGGKIVNTGSKSAVEAGSRNSAYSASKSQVLRLTESMAKAYHKDRINVNCVLPGTLDTPDNREMMPDADYSKWANLEEVTNLYLFLASDLAKAVNGALIPTYG